MNEQAILKQIEFPHALVEILRKNPRRRFEDSNLRVYAKLLEQLDPMLIALRKQQVRLRKR